ncbi:MAG: metal-sensing transcriptional repressor [Christensenellaceae bacterium]
MNDECSCNKKLVKRDNKDIKALTSRLNRIIGQLNGIKAMIEDNRYCKDVLVQIIAAEKALQSFGYLILEDHLSGCVVTKIKEGDQDIIDETVDLIRRINNL